MNELDVDLSEDYGKLIFGALDVKGDGIDLEDTRNALWKVSVIQEKYGDTPKYSFINVATGQYLSVPTLNALNDRAENVSISGSFMEWYNGLSSSDIPVGTYNDFMSYVKQNEVVVLQWGDQIRSINGTSISTNVYGVDIQRLEVGNVNSGTAIQLRPYKADVVNLGATELNKELIMNSEDDESFTLSFNRDVTEGADNLFTGVELVATDVQSQPGYVQIHVKDTKNYLVVDTALHAGSEALKQLPKFTYDDPNKDVVDGNNVKRNPKSFNFKFAYDPTSNRLLIKVQQWTKKLPSDFNNGKPYEVSGAGVTGDSNTAYTYWPTSYNDGSTIKNTVDDAYVRLVELSNVRELTVASDDVNGESNWLVGSALGADDLENGMLTTVTIGAGLNSYVPTTIPTGLYLIQYKSGNEVKAAADNYFVANLGGALGYAEQAVRQAYDHMPAAQWYVEQQGTIATAPVKITNREFFDQDYYSAASQLGEDGISYQAFQGPDGNYFFLNGAFANDTLKFIPVSDASKADSLLGYKHVDAKQASVETYVFNYLHGLSKDNGLNTPSDKDSLVRVDETGEKVAFRLIPVVEHDSYGIQLDAEKTGVANLIRNAYYVEAYDNLKFAEDGENRYLTYDKASKKYVMSKTPTAYFLKENNCVDGNHYYALVEANFYKVQADKFVPNLSSIVFYPQEYAGLKVEDNKEVKEYKANYSTNKSKLIIKFYDKNGQPIVTDASEDVVLYAYQENNKGVVELARVKRSSSSSTAYYWMNSTTPGYSVVDGNKIDDNNKNYFASDEYASSRVSVDDNTLDLTNAVLDDKWTAEIRVSAFEVAVNDAPLYRRFNGANGEFGTAANAPLNLKFYRFNNDQEYLFENYSSENSYRDGITDKEISFLGVNNAKQFAENETRSYTMYVDTAYVRNNTRMPQYLIGVRPEVVPGDTIWCNATSAHHHETLADSLACDHTIINAGFTRAMYLFNAQDSVDVKNYDYQGKAAYGAAGYTRLAFKDAVHANDTLYILNPGVTTEQLKATNLKDGSLFADKINLGNNDHKNVVFQFRLIDEDNNRFLIESESDPEMIAPMKGGWIKVQNGVPVIARFDTFQEAIRQAEVFDVNDEIKYDAVDNEEIAVEGVSVVAGNGQVTIMGAAGKNVTITNILGKVIASQVIASDNATIAVPAGIVAVAVEGEAAVKAIVK